MVRGPFAPEACFRHLLRSVDVFFPCLLSTYVGACALLRTLLPSLISRTELSRALWGRVLAVALRAFSLLFCYHSARYYIRSPPHASCTHALSPSPCLWIGVCDVMCGRSFFCTVYLRDCRALIRFVSFHPTPSRGCQPTTCRQPFSSPPFYETLEALACRWFTHAVVVFCLWPLPSRLRVTFSDAWPFQSIAAAPFSLQLPTFCG